jgi:erythromycin 3''-O-methyltransferase
MIPVQRSGVWQDMRVLGRAIRLTLSTPENRAREIYSLYPPDSKLTDDTYYLNMGYWQAESDTIDEASIALAEKVARSAGFRPGDRILDAGFGYGDQDFLWLDRFQPERIVGLNVTRQQTRVAQERAVRRGVADRVDFREGSATAMTFEPGSFDRVVALESAFHFVSREDFFREAFGVLRPGGVLATADIVPLDARPRDGKKGLGSFTYMIPDENWYDSASYQKHLLAAGFRDVRLTSIRDHVWEPWYRSVSRKMHDPAVRRHAGRIYYHTLRHHLRKEDRWRKDFANLDYVIAVAQKPDPSTRA